MGNEGRKTAYIVLARSLSPSFLQKDQIHPQCKQLLDDCKQQVLEVTERVRTVLK